MVARPGLSLSKTMKKILDGVYTGMLRAALNVSWEDHIRNVDLYGFLQRLTLSGNGA